MNFQGLRFEKPGNFSIDLTVDGELASRVPFRWCRCRKKLPRKPDQHTFFLSSRLPFYGRRFLLPRTSKKRVFRRRRIPLHHVPERFSTIKRRGAGAPGRYRYTPPETDAAGNPALPPGRPALHFAEIQPGNVEVGFSPSGRNSQDNQHQGKQAQPPCHFKGIAGHFRSTPMQLQERESPPDPPLQREPQT